ncbi:HAL protein kinase [Allomyces macrogynus ATCC 38327]|uniref:non-specific serine/threonine protein kinase n=1 Tax=Allomyces macrogynus (strain ATCC 38327) TaxID=578462 RepID=A0A0L0RYA0_ALLM3|nr:HAL protein kinase [Allomyces macrogynus ATCC 38327]|eukprot:KNE55130.1 HAL protein kinase [Allomyces macrogynus ATCC 38327]
MTTSAAASPDTAAGLPAQPVSPPSSPPVARARKLSTPNAVAPAARSSRADLAPAPAAPALPTPSMTPPLLASPKLPPVLVAAPATPPAPAPVTLPAVPPSPPAPVPVERRSSFKEMLLSMKNRTQSLWPQRKSDAAATKAAAATAAGASSANDRGKLSEKYGVSIKGVIGKGATAQVRLVAKPDESAPDGPSKIYAVKEFRKRRKNETEKQHMRKLTAEFCISSSLHHINVVETIDLIQDENEHWCEVMEYCAGGDLYSIIKTGQMDQNEIDCCFKQLVMGVHYLHAHGIGHRDIKPENLLLNTEGHLKITDFGVSEVFKMCWESEPHLSKGICGSEPYIAPEEFAGGEYDARQVDVWAVGVVYYAMTYRGIPWKQATKADPNYAYYLSNRKRNFEALDRLPDGCRELMYKILEPDPRKRITVAEIISDAWFKSIQVCFHCPEYDHPADPLANVNHAPPTPRSDANHIHHINAAPIPPIPVTPTAAAAPHGPTRSRSNSAASAHLDAMLTPQAAAAAAAAAAASPPRRARSRSRSITAAVLGRPPAPQPAMPAIPSDADVALADARSPQRKSNAPSRATSPTGSTGSKGSDGKRKKRPSLSRIEAAVKDLLNL